MSAIQFRVAAIASQFTHVVACGAEDFTFAKSAGPLHMTSCLPALGDLSPVDSQTLLNLWPMTRIPVGSLDLGLPSRRRQTIDLST